MLASPTIFVAIALSAFPPKTFKTYLRMKGNGCYKIYVLEAAKTLFSRHVPQAHRLVHAGRQYEVVLQWRLYCGGHCWAAEKETKWLEQRHKQGCFVSVKAEHRLPSTTWSRDTVIPIMWSGPRLPYWADPPLGDWWPGVLHYDYDADMIPHGRPEKSCTCMQCFQWLILSRIWTTTGTYLRPWKIQEISSVATVNTERLPHERCVFVLFIITHGLKKHNCSQGMQHGKISLTPK